jgi:hypothetical protein
VCVYGLTNRAHNVNYFLRVKVKVEFNLGKATKAQRGSRGIALLFLLTSALDGGGWSAPRPGRFTFRKDPVLIV